MTPAASTSRSIQLPRQARSRETRRKILEGAAACLVERGYGGTSTTEIVRRAGVSQGALFKHFPSKRALLGAAAEHLFVSLIAQYERSSAELEERSGRARLDAALRLLRCAFSEPGMQAVLELSVVARTNSDLRMTIEPVLREQGGRLRRLARSLFAAEAEGADDSGGFVDLVLDAMQGAAVGALVLPDAEREARVLETIERWASAQRGDEEPDGHRSSSGQPAELTPVPIVRRRP